MQRTSFEYRSRKPEETVLYRVIAEQLETFLARQQDRERPLPKFVEQEFRSFLECGIPAYGFVRVHCDSCGHDRVVAFSCKGRVWCPGCGGRRMADTAAHLVDHVFPLAPVRQWVLSSPFALRYKMAYDSHLMSEVLNIFARAVLGHLRRRAGKWLGLRNAQSGAVTFIQRFGDALNCNIHFHLLALDGVYTRTENYKPEFHELPAPEDDEMVDFTTVAATRIQSLLDHRGLGAESEDEDALSRDDPGMAVLYASSIRGRVAVGSNMGSCVARLGDQIDGDSIDVLQSPRCATVNGFSVHANVSIPEHDRMRLERLCRYAARPAVATERLSELPDGRLLYRLKRPWRNGTTAVIFEPQDLLAKLAALVPAPRVHLVRFHGSVKWIRYSAKIKSLKERLIEEGWLTVQQVSARLRIDRGTINKRRLKEQIKARVCNDHTRYIGTLSRKLYDSININSPNFLYNGLKEAFDAARSGAESSLLDQMFKGINIAGTGCATAQGTAVTCGAVGTTVNGVLQTGAMHLRAATSANIRNNLANGNYQALATSFSTLNYSKSSSGNASLPDIAANEAGAVLRFNGFPENFIKANPQFNNATLLTNSGNTNYHSLQVQATLRSFAGVRDLQASYTWSKLLGRAATGTTATYTNPVDRSGDYTLQIGDRRHDFRTNGTFELPVGPGQKFFRNSSGVVGRLIEGWKFSWIVQLTSGAPGNITAQNMLYGNGTPDIVGKFDPGSGNVSWQNGAPNGNYFSDAYKKATDPQCATVAASIRSLCTLTAITDVSGNVVLQNPLPGTRGTLGQNAIEMPGTWSFDSGFGKRVKIDETKALTIRMDATNIFNHPQPATLNFDINSALPLGNISTKTGNRSFQAQMRLDF